MPGARRSSLLAVCVALCALCAWVPAARAATTSDSIASALNPAAGIGPKLTQSKAIAIARKDARVQRELAAHTKPGQRRLIASASYVDGRLWEVRFSRKSKVKVQVDVPDASANVTGVWTGHQIPWKMARGDRRAFGGDINEPLLWWSMVLLFLVWTIDWRAWRSLLTVDLLMLMSFTVSHEFYNHGAIDWSVPLAYPPLVWLFVRMSWLFVRGVPAARTTLRDARWQPPFWVVVVLCVFAAGVRIGLNHYGSTVVDVGYAGAAGAHEILHGNLPYGHMPTDNPHGDTYGPLNYLLYLPAVLLFGYDGNWGGPLPAAHLTAIAADLAVVVGLFMVGCRWMSREAGAFLAFAWLVCPYPAFDLEGNVNDALIAALLVWSLVAMRHAWVRGALIGAAAMVKFVPLLALAPVMHVGVARRVRQSALCLFGACAVFAVCMAFVAAYEPRGFHRFLHATVGFQYDRDSPFSVWGLYHWRTLQIGVQAVLLIAVAAAVVWPRVRDARQVAAGVAAAMIGVQIVLQHWFYLYIPWFVAPMLVVCMAQREMVAAPLASRGSRDAASV
jgi:hypothetical protein